MKKLSVAVASLLFGAQAFAACPTGTTATADVIDAKPSCILEGTIANNNLVLDKSYAWILKGDVRIGNDTGDKMNKSASSLTLKAGTVVYGSPQSFLVINRDAKINVEGSVTEPVVFTSLERSNPFPGYWGGLVITGNAQINNCKNVSATGFCEGFIEGVASEIAPKYGGNNNDDSSGSIKYLRVEYAGYTFGKDSELNAITFYGVGRGTTVEYIQAYKGADDGIELFGGTVNLRYVVSTDNDDDGFDWDQGWSGAAQFVFVELENASEKDPRGIEADNFKDNHAATPRSQPVLSNVTIVGRGTNPKLLDGIMLRHGTGGIIYNAIVAGNFQNCLNVDSDETFAVGGVANSDGTVSQTAEIVLKTDGSVDYTKGLGVQNVILQCNQTAISEDAADLWSLTKWFEQVVDMNNYVMPMSDAVLTGDIPVSGGPADKTGYLPPDAVFPGNYSFLQVDYVGAFNPKSAKWTEGWVAK